MKKLCLITLVVPFLFGCQSNLEKDKARSNDSLTRKPATVVAAKVKDSSLFLNDCKKLMQQSYIGALQGTRHSKDSTNFLCFAACYDCKITYETIFLYKGGVDERKSLGYQGLSKEFDNACSNNFSKFDAFAFVLPLKDPDKQEDTHALNMDFPVNVKVYHSNGGNNWQYDKTVNVKTFEEYSNLQFSTIYLR